MNYDQSHTLKNEVISYTRVRPTRFYCRIRGLIKFCIPCVHSGHERRRRENYNIIIVRFARLSINVTEYITSIRGKTSYNTNLKGFFAVYRRRETAERGGIKQSRCDTQYSATDNEISEKERRTERKY